MRLSSAQISACALTHGAPASGDDERPLVRQRVLKPVAESRETPIQNRHRKCVLHCLIGSTGWSFPLIGWVLLPADSNRLGIPTRRVSDTRNVKHPSGFLFAASRIRSSALTLSPSTEYGASLSLPNSPWPHPWAAPTRGFAIPAQWSLRLPPTQGRARRGIHSRQALPQ